MGNAIILSSKNAYANNNIGKVTFIMIDSTYLCITALENITISFSNNLEYNDRSSIYWKTLEANTELQIENGITVSFRGDLVPTKENGIGTFNISGECTVSGHVLGLLKNEILVNYSFKKLFENCTGITDASGLILPDEVKKNCYESMFKGCTSLTTSPTLYATTLVTDCYKEMFYGCSSLNKITICSEVQLSSLYCNNWVYGVSLTGILYNTSELTYTEIGVHGIPEGWEVKVPYESLYFTIESLADSNTISINKAKSPSNLSLSYSTNDGETWTDLTISSTTTFTTINTGDKIIFKGINDKFASAWDTYYRFNASKNFKVYGNAMSLLFGDDYKDNSEFATGTTHNLCGLFYGTTTLIDAENLILPATILTTSCYNGTFRGCTNLTIAPQLPGTESAQDCYSSMFEGCINLEVAPEINLVNMSQTCCKRMFIMDRSNKITTPKMTKSPILRCPTGAGNCYEEMFKGNGNLIEVTCLMTSGFQCANWLLNGSSTGTFKKAQSASWSTGTSSIPSGWTIENYTE